MHIITLFCFTSEWLENYFRSPLLLSCRCVAVVPPNVATIKFYSGSALPHSKVLRREVFLTLEKVPVSTTVLSKFFKIFRIYSGGPDLKVSTLNAYVLEVVMLGLRRRLILMRLLSLI